MGEMSPLSLKMMKVFKVRNRWLCTFIYLSAIFFTSCTYYGWQHMQRVLVLAGNYEDQCPGITRPDDAARDEYLCDKQANMIDTANIIASSCEFCGGLLAGLMYDNLGPAVTVMVGELMHFASWPIILLSNGNTAMSNTGFALMGLAVNPVAIPAMLLTLRFPRHVFLHESLNLAAQSSTSFIMPVIYSLMMANPSWTFNDVMSVFLSVAAVVAVFYIAFLPWKQAQCLMEIKEETNKKTAQNLSIHAKYHGVFHYVKKPVYLFFTIWYTSMIMSHSVLTTRLDQFAGTHVSEVVGWIFWLQAPFGILGGLVNEKVATIKICWVLTLVTTLAYILVTVNWSHKDKALKGGQSVEDYEADWKNSIMFYIGGFLYVAANSYIYTVKYTWVSSMFPHVHFGTLTGIISVVAGLLQFINTATVGLEPLTTMAIYGAGLGVLEYILLALITKSRKHTFLLPINQEELDAMNGGARYDAKGRPIEYEYYYYDAPI